MGIFMNSLIKDQFPELAQLWEAYESALEKYDNTRKD